MSAPVVAEIVRSGFVEGHHYGSVVALDRDGSVAWSVGDVDVPVLPRSCNKPIQALGMVRARPRPAAGPARPGLRLALGRAVPHRGRTPDPGGRGPRRVRAPDAARLPARRRGPRGRHPGRRRAGAGADELLRQARGDAGHLRGQRLGHRDLPARSTTRSSRRSRATFAELTGEPVEHVAVDGCGAPLLSTSLTGLARAFRAARGGHGRARRRRVAAAIRQHPEFVSGHPARRARPAHRGARARSARPAPSPATRWRCPTAGLRAQDRRRRPAGAAGADGRGAAPLRRDGRGRRGRRRRDPDRDPRAARRWRPVGEIRAAF